MHVRLLQISVLKTKLADDKAKREKEFSALVRCAAGLAALSAHAAAYSFQMLAFSEGVKFILFFLLNE